MATAPEAARNHPTDEHLLPLFVAMGAGGAQGVRLHHSYTYDVLAMDAYAFGEPQTLAPLAGLERGVHDIGVDEAEPRMVENAR